MKKIIFVFFIVCSIARIYAFNTVMFCDYNNSITIGIGTDLSILTLRLNYARSLDVSEWQYDPVLNTGFSLPLFKPDFKDFRINVGVTINTINAGHFNVPASLNLIYRGNSNEAFNSSGFGMEIGLFPGYYNEVFTAAAELLWDTQLLTHIEYSDYYTEHIYGEVPSGWYSFTSNMFRLGARTGMLIGDRDEISLRGGYEYHGKYNLKVPPFYAVLSNSMRF